MHAEMMPPIGLVSAWDYCDSKQLGVAVSNRLTTIDLKSMKMLHQSAEQPFQGTSVSISSDGSSILVGTLRHGILRFALKSNDGEIGHSEKLVDDELIVSDILHIPDSTKFAFSATRGHFRIFDLVSQTVSSRLDTETRTGPCFAVSPDGKFVVRDLPLSLIDAKMGDVLFRFPSNEKPANRVTAIRFEEFSDQLAIGFENGIIEIWNIREGQRIHRLSGHSEPVTSLCFSALPDRLFSGDRAGKVKWWFLPENSQIATFSLGEAIVGLWVDPAGKQVVAIPSSGQLKSWNTAPTE